MSLAAQSIAAAAMLDGQYSRKLASAHNKKKKEKKKRGDYSVYARKHIKCI